MKPPLYTIRSLVHAYDGGPPVLAIERLSVAAGSILGLVGPNGSGKSTLLKLLAFVEKPTRGEIRFKDRPAAPFSDAVRFQVTLLTQEPYLMRRSVYANVAYGLKLRGRRRDCRPQVAAALSLVGLAAEHFADRKWYQLSGGEAQRVSLAARLALQPEALLLDEPTASVDAASAELIKAAVIRARDQWGTTLVIASHDRQWLYEICDDSLHLFRGRILESGADNLLFGPWQPGPAGFWHKPLAGGGALRVPPPPDDQAVGVLDARAVSLAAPGAASPPGLNTLDGVVSRLVLEKNTRRIVATISVGLLALTVKLDPERLQALHLYPGKAVRIHFAPQAVAWCDPA